VGRVARVKEKCAKRVSRKTSRKTSS